MMGDSHISRGHASKRDRARAIGWTVDTLFYGKITAPAKMILDDRPGH